ncbi:MAG: lysogenization regulator HflD [Methylococcaceae bacterium]|nr:MAG: lysogenization regulator HflD [Methylococcaceae bacterium]
MLKSLPNQTLALAGLAQAVYLVQQIARNGRADEGAMEASIHSLFKIDAVDVPDVYGGVANVHLGLRQLLKQLGGAEMDPEVTGYAATLMVLERKLMSDGKMVDAVHHGVERIALLADTCPSVLDSTVIGELATLYQQTISTLMPKVRVGGEQKYLCQTHNAERIRALLLAGLRSTVLWRQAGGTRWALLFQRRRIVGVAQFLLNPAQA